VTDIRSGDSEKGAETQPDAAAEALSVAALVIVLGWAVRWPRGWPEAVAAVPAALLVIATRVHP
jgi:hypothetical protein